MQYEIDFLPVGDGEKGGDAIAFRYSTDEGHSWFIGVIDGGTKETGKALCEHIDKYYSTTKINVIINSHPDGDHASGLTEVIGHYDVDLILMHRPWEHVDEIYQFVEDRRVTREGLKDRLKEHLPFAWEIEKLSGERNITLREPFSDEMSYLSSNIYLLSPNRELYMRQLIRYRSIQEFTQPAQFSARRAFEAARRAAQAGIRWIAESWDNEKLVDPAYEATSGENNTSTILLLNFEQNLCLLTADAGVPALEQAYECMVNLGLPVRSFRFVQIPHHGSKRNVGPTILNKLVGEPAPKGQRADLSAFLSVPKNGEPKHPSLRVINAFTRRGGRVIPTKGNSISHAPNMRTRPNWSNATPLPFYDRVEEDD